MSKFGKRLEQLLKESDMLFEPLPLIEVGDSRFISLVTYYLHEPHFRTVPALVYFYIT
jgi:hypothetical protein